MSSRYWPQLDGMRALAIVAVIAYHLGYLSGGWLGVDLFFVLSGYLITSILLEAGPWGGLRRFWGRRARRLFPAVLLLLLVLSIYTWAGGPGMVAAQFRAPALSTLFYVANWQQIISGHGYFAAFTAPSPIQPTWSLAIEEQYYMVWPLVMATLVLCLGTARARLDRRAVLVVTASLGIASAIWMGVAAHLYGPNRAYLGTDSRAWELFLGGTLVLIWPQAQKVASPKLWSWLSGLGLAAFIVGIAVAGGPPSWIWDGGLVVIAAAAGFFILGSVRSPEGPVTRFFSLGPLRWIGLISYSLYLWHWPVIVLMTPATTGLAGTWLLLARLAAMTAASCASYYLIEQPLRKADWQGWAKRLHVPVVSFAVVGMLLTAVVIWAGTVGPPAASSAKVGPSPSPTAGTIPLTGSLSLPPATVSDPYRLWMIGDSVMHDAAPGVKAALEATGTVKVVTDTTYPGWGLTRISDWPQTVAQVTASSQPNLLMGTWSWDDEAAQGSPAAYEAQLTAAMATALAPGTGIEGVILIEFPQAGPPVEATTLSPAQQLAAWTKQVALQDAWNAAAKAAVLKFPGHAVFLPTSELFAPKGRFLTWFKTPTGTWLRARKLDNAHFCPYGAAQFGALIARELSPSLSLPALTSGWETGAWTTDPRYNDPPGACPADQPSAGYTGQAVPRAALPTG